MLARAGACRTCVGTASSGACSSRRPAGAPVAPCMALGVAVAGGCGMAAGVAVAAGAPLCAGAGVSAGAPGGAGAGAPTGASSGSAAATAAGGTAAAAATAARYLAPAQRPVVECLRDQGGQLLPSARVKLVAPHCRQLWRPGLPCCWSSSARRRRSGHSSLEPASWPEACGGTRWRCCVKSGELVACADGCKAYRGAPEACMFALHRGWVCDGHG